ncbi:MAG TPA: dipeptide epimerase [Verrucomicrobiae bacterium]|nr:dipeptide epimerase [Verrucomicrobiae bacterium]
MKLKLHACELKLVNPWRIASSMGSGAHIVVLFELTDRDGVTGLGEAAPASTYQETAAGVMEFCQGLDAGRLSFADIPGSMAWVNSLPGMPSAARCGLNLALLDGAAKRAGQPVHDFLKLGFRENHHLTSFSIGIDSPEVVAKKVADAAAFPVLKLKVGDPRDRENFAALRSVAPRKPVRVDANEGWKTKEQALTMLETLAQDGHVQFVEQPMPRNAAPEDLIWLKERSPLPLYADESCHNMRDIPHCAECFHGVNVKLVKTGGISMAYETLQAARQTGLQTMIGCMIETSVLISAAAHLAELADHLDIDGNLLINNDPFRGATAVNGVISFADAPAKTGLCVAPRA